mgnify:CR=1 FL=1
MWNKKTSFYLLVIFFFLFHILFNLKSIYQVFNPSSIQYQFLGDYSQAEYIIENNYQKIKNFENPFILERETFYPFKLNLALNDPGISAQIFYFFVRPFFNVHQSMALIIFLNQFLALLIMYLLLKKIEVQDFISIPLSLSYSILPIIPFSIYGALTYTFIFIFPLTFILFINLLNTKSTNKKFIMTILLGLLSGMTLLLNFYYFLSLILIVLVYFLIYLFQDRNLLIKIIKVNLKYSILYFLSFLLIVSFWLFNLNNLIELSYTYPDMGFGGSVELAGDLAGFFIPSEYNPFYSFFIEKLTIFSNFFVKLNKFFLSNTVKFIYPGVLILSVYLYIIVMWKKLNPFLKRKVSVFYWHSIFFGLLLLGPFLKIFNKWVLDLEGIAVILPLPFLALQNLPGFAGLRAPTRFFPIFIFFAIIVVSLLLNHLFKNYHNKQKIQLFTILIFIIIFDQIYINPLKNKTYFPLKIYEIIKNEKNSFTVFEIPFTLRDGFEYIGYVHAIGPMNGQLIYNKPLIGGYMARVPKEIFDYYKNKRFVKYVADIIDKGNYNPIKGRPNNIKIYPYPYPLSTISNELIELNIRYIVIKNDEDYSDIITNLISKIGFDKKITDFNYDLYIR